MMKTESENRFNEIFEKLVPNCGMAETLGGEIVRAVSRIGYRYYNDGDMAWEGYGRETVNPAVRFLQSVCESESLPEYFTKHVEKIFYREPYSSESEYEQMVDDLAIATIELIESTNLSERKNTFGDMLKFSNPEEDVDRDEDEDEDWF